MRKQKRQFKPVITRVKLNPEQAVLTCNCYNTGITGFSQEGPYGPAGCQLSIRQFQGNYLRRPWGANAVS